MNTLIRHGLVYDGEDGTYSPQDILIENSRISAVYPEGSGHFPSDKKIDRIIDAAGYLVFPGFIDAHSHMGMWVSQPLGNDCNECSDPVTPGVRAVDGINPRNTDFQKALAAGFTTMMLTPGSGNVICGQAATVKLHGNSVRAMVRHPYSALKAALGENPISVYGPVGKTPSSRMANASILDEVLAQAWEYSQRPEEEQKDPYWNVFLPLFARKIPLKIHAHRADDILTAIRIAEKYPIRYTLDHCTEGYLIADELASRNIPILIGPLFMFKNKDELRNASERNPIHLVEKGCSVSLISDHPFANTLYLGAQAGLLMKAGLSERDALNMLTVNPAKALDLDNEIGSLVPGKTADIILYQGSPLEMRSRCVMTILEGEVVHACAKERITCC